MQGVGMSPCHQDNCVYMVDHLACRLADRTLADRTPIQSWMITILTSHDLHQHILLATKLLYSVVKVYLACNIGDVSAQNAEDILHIITCM